MVGQDKDYLVQRLTNQILPSIGGRRSFAFLKDNQHRYLGCNNNYAQLLGLDDEKKIIGLTDLILNPDHANIYQADDKRVLNGEILEINNPAYFKGTGLVNVSGRIIPVRDESNDVTCILGITTLIFRLADKPFVQAMAMLNSTSIPLIVSKYSYTVNTRYGDIKISKREAQCILFLFKSFTSDAIAQSLDLSVRSVESYFVNIKNKLNVRHKSEIIDAVLAGGLLEQL